MAVVNEQEAAVADEATTVRRPCANCPWRAVNHGKRTPWGFYSAANMRRLWNQIRRGGAQSCHPTDPNHPDHVAAGAKPGSTPLECPGAVILVLREATRLASYGADGNTVDEQAIPAYLRNHRDGLTKTGIMYWVVQRIALAGKPFIGGAPLPAVDEDEAGIARL